MSRPIVHGFPQSSYVWTTRATLALKGVDYDFVALQPGDHKSPEHLARHPYGKVPSFRHGDVALYESSAIAHYVDAAFDGPALIPSDPAAMAEVEMWISVVNCYFYGQAVPGYLFKYIFAKDGPDRAAIDEVVPKLRHSAGLIDAAVGEGTWLVGDSLTLADVFVGPLLFVLARLPEGQQILADHPGAQRLQRALAETGPFMQAAPPQG